MQIEIYKTNNYEIFKRLKGNRDITNKRIAIIKKSIESIGYISNPIIVNQNMEVIDGQGRLEALMQLELEIEYRVINGIGIDECRAMNLKPTSWTMNDFIESYAEYGNESYIRLKELNDKYKFGYSLIYSVVTNKPGAGNSVSDGVRSGNFVISHEEYVRVDYILKYLRQFTEIQKRIGGRKDVFYSCLGWIVRRPDVDLERLSKNVINNYSLISPPAQNEITLKELSEAYNKGYGKANRRYFDYEFKTRNTEKIS